MAKRNQRTIDGLDNLTPADVEAFRSKRRTKYTLIERPEYNATAVPTSLLQDIIDSGENVTASRPVSLAEIKRENYRVMTEEQWRWDMEQRARLEAFEAYRTRYHGVVTKALVLSWDFLRGEGLVRLESGEAREIYACNLPGRKTWFPETACAFYEPGETVEVKLDIHLTKTFVLGVTQAYIDNEKWDSIKDKNLSFRCDDDGKAITGLGVDLF